MKAIAEQQSQVIAQLLVLKEQFISRVYNEVLNPEQRTKADTMRREWTQHINQHLQEHSQVQQNR